MAGSHSESHKLNDFALCNLTIFGVDPDITRNFFAVFEREKLAGTAWLAKSTSKMSTFCFFNEYVDPKKYPKGCLYLIKIPDSQTLCRYYIFRKIHVSNQHSVEKIHSFHQVLTDLKILNRS